MLAAQVLAEGFDTPALRQAAGCSRRDDPRDARAGFGRARTRNSAPGCPPGGCRAGAGRVRRPGTARRCGVRRRVPPGGLEAGHLDDAIYPGLPDGRRDLVLMCFPLGTGRYAESGGEERLPPAARALAARPPAASVR